MHSMTLRPRHKLIFLAGAASRTEYFISGDCSSLYALTSTMQTLHKTSTFRTNSRPFRENGQKLEIFTIHMSVDAFTDVWLTK